MPPPLQPTHSLYHPTPTRALPPLTNSAPPSPPHLLQVPVCPVVGDVEDEQVATPAVLDKLGSEVVHLPGCAIHARVGRLLVQVEGPLPLHCIAAKRMHTETHTRAPYVRKRRD